MSGFNKVRLPSCCGSFKIHYELNFPLMRESLTQLESAGFVISKPFLSAGMIYAENNKLSVVGKIGGNSLELKCKVPRCDAMTTQLEEVLTLIYDSRKQPK